MLLFDGLFLCYALVMILGLYLFEDVMLVIVFVIDCHEEDYSLSLA